MSLDDVRESVNLSSGSKTESEMIVMSTAALDTPGAKSRAIGVEK